MWKEMSFLAWFMSQEKRGHSMPYLCWNKKKTTKSKPEIKKRLFFKKVEKQSPANALGEIEGNAPGIVNSSNNYQGLKQKRWNYRLGEGGAETDKGVIVNRQKLQKKFGQHSFFVASTLLENGGFMKSPSPASLLKGAIYVISCGYQGKTNWGRRYGGGLNFSERFSYINYIVYPSTSILLLAYCTLPAICLIDGKFITSEDESARLWNVHTWICILIFSGAAGHRNEVLSVQDCISVAIDAYTRVRLCSPP
ncbi:hypothetical protein GUJ93_ZPchr0004g38595 [Zizania palustris]|uniref:Uncharacterized protein n=1 Tax=Zizania palustris TaxID=103762 RepID=A0A8J5SKR5_ZIZPA|nr:hypothetical protein GUJ93_ZPchr0004g38595 [Zizania palustris]